MTLTLDRRSLLSAAIMSIAWPLAAHAQQAEPAGELPEWSLGAENAPVTVVQYASLTCHHCQNFHQNTWPEVKARYVDTGKVRFVVKEFPLDQLALAGFMLARCAPSDRWYEVVDRLYQTSEDWAHSPNPGEALKAEANGLGFTDETFAACLKDQPIYDGILATIRGGQFRGVASTPTFFVNGVRKVGAPTIEQFAAMVDPLLK